MVDIVESLISGLCSPYIAFRDHTKTEFLICLALYIFIPVLGGLIYLATLKGFDLCPSLLIGLPPVSVFFSKGCSIELLISIALILPGYYLAPTYAFHLLRESGNKGANSGYVQA